MRRHWFRRERRAASLLTAVSVVAIGTAGCSSADPSGSDTNQLALVAYSVAKPAYDALEAAFANTPEGAGTSWASSYGPSGTQSQAVRNGQRADYVAFSLAPDLTKLAPKFV